MPRQNLVWVFIFVATALMFLRLPQMVARQDSVVHTYGPLVEVDALARKYYVTPIEDERLVDGAITGLLRRLDPYSGYIAADELADFYRRHSGNYCGVGLEVGVRDGQTCVIAPVEGGPAARAGVSPGDVILAIDGADVEGLSVFAINDRLAGDPGTPVRLRVRHPGQPQPETMIVERAAVRLVSVRGFRRAANGQWDYMIDSAGGIGYIRVSSFRDNTMGEFNEALAVLSARGLRGLILDLRFNPGGSTHQAIAMVDRFVDRGVILSIVTRRQATQEFHATEHESLTALPLVILVNGASASSAEIVAGCLQDLDRATVVGERSFGKGSVQHLIPLTGHQAAIKLTVAHYQLPSGRVIHRQVSADADEPWGVIPDVVIPLSEEETSAIRRARATLDQTLGAGIDSTGAADGGIGQPPDRQVPLDRQLGAAFAILKDRTDRR